MFEAREVNLRILFWIQITVNKINEVMLYFHLLFNIATLAVRSFGLKSNICCKTESDWSQTLPPADVQPSS